MTPKEISTMLAKDAESIAKMLLGGGKREGNEWRAGSVDGEEGKSLGVHLTGQKAGIWADFSSNQSGDLLDLWAVCRGVSIGDAIKQAKAHLGIHDVELYNTRKEYRKPEKPRCHKPKSAVLEYLTSRKITPEAIEAYKVAATDDEVLFPYLRDGELVNAKYRNIHDKKKMRIEAGCELCLFGWQAISETARSVTICEGEIDALTLWQYGFPALSIPNGAGSHTWVENEYSNLDRFDEIYLCFDMDEAGRKGVQELASRLGRERCRVVELPKKDPNDCLVAGIDIEKYFHAAKTIDPVELRNAKEFVNEVIDQLHPKDGIVSGFVAPWNKTHDHLRFRPAELILLNGINGHGKSQTAGHILLHAMKQGKRVCIFSGEIKPRMLMARLTRQAAGFGNPSIPYIHAIHDWLGEHLWIFDLVGTAKADKLIEVFRYARKRYGIDVFLIDSLLKCGISEESNDAQKDFVTQVADFKNETESTVFMITHSKKLEKESVRSDKFDIRGAAAIGDLADTILATWRNKKREELLEKGDADSLAEAEKQPGAILKCHKQRNGDWEKEAWLYFDQESYQFLGNPSHRPLPYVQFQEAKHA